MKIVGMLGGKGHGKDTAASALVEAGWRNIAFADALYLELAEAYGVSVQFLQNRDTKERPLMELAPMNCCKADFVKLLVSKFGTLGACQEAGFSYPFDMAQPMSPRSILQLWGTDYRRAENDAYWREKVAAVLLDNNGHHNWVVTDVRFPDEAQLLKSIPGANVAMVKVVRPALVAAAKGDSHISERAMDDYKVDVLLVNQENSVGQLKQSMLKAVCA